MNSECSPGISNISVYLPESILGNDEIIERFAFKPNFLINKLGIETRHVAGVDESVADMAVKAGKSLLNGLQIKKNSIGLIVLCTQNPDYNVPATVNTVQDRLGFSKNIAAFEINQGCSGYLYGLSMVKALMLTENFSRAVFITSEAYSKVINPDDRNTVPIFGDGATATFLEAGGSGRIGKFIYGSDGSGFDKLIVKGGGSRRPDLERKGDAALYMDGAAIFKFMMTVVPQNIKDCLRRNALNMDDIDYFVFHQASRYMLENLAYDLKINMDKIPISLKKTGNTVSSTIPITIQHLGGPAKLKGCNVLLSGFGTGLSWASTILKF